MGAIEQTSSMLRVLSSIPATAITTTTTYPYTAWLISVSCVNLKSLWLTLSLLKRFSFKENVKSRESLESAFCLCQWNSKDLPRNTGPHGTFPRRWRVRGRQVGKGSHCPSVSWHLLSDPELWRGKRCQELMSVAHTDPSSPVSEEEINERLKCSPCPPSFLVHKTREAVRRQNFDV